MDTKEKTDNLKTNNQLSQNDTKQLENENKNLKEKQNKKVEEQKGTTGQENLLKSQESTQEELENKSSNLDAKNKKSRKKAKIISVKEEVLPKEEKPKNKNFLVRLWNYYSTYEKIWLISICTVGILLGIFFPEDPNQPSWLRVIQIIVIIGGCSCELLLSKQSKWAFIVSFVLYDTTQTIVYFATGLYISALFEIIFWMPILFVSFHFWEKQEDPKNKLLTQVKEVNWKRDLVIFVVVLVISVGTGIAFTSIGGIFEGFTEYWYLDALANTFSVCNGLFLVFRFREQWLPWICVAFTESIIWILEGQYIMLVLEVGYLMNSLYGLIMWNKYIKKNKTNESPKQGKMKEIKN